MIESHISHFYSRLSGTKRKATDRGYDQTMGGQPMYSQRGQYPPMNRGNFDYNSHPQSMKPGQGPGFYPSHEMAKSRKLNGIHQTLNFTSNKLNRENSAGYKAYYSNSQQKGPGVKDMGEGYPSQGRAQQMAQSQNLQETYWDSSRQQKSREQLSMRGSMQSYKNMAD
jgi:hypothetical protein